MDVLRRLVTDESGQDLVEYVLLGATVAIGSVVAINSFGPIINAVYFSWQTETLNLWYPEAPAP